MVRSLCCTLFFMLSITLVTGQEVDHRLVRNRGSQAQESFKYNKTMYNYFLFELDRSHWIAEKGSLTPEEKALVAPAAQFTNADGEALTLTAAQASDFNFYDYGIRLKKESRIYIALDKAH